MQKHLFTILFLSGTLLLAVSCHKNNADSPNNPTPPPPQPIVDRDSGSFLALIDTTVYHPIYHYAIYYSKWKQLYIRTTDSSTDIGRHPTLYGGVNLDASNQLKTYLLEPNGENTFSLNDYYSDHNATDAGGTFTLTKLDTIKRVMSGTLQFTGYHKDGRKINFRTTAIENIPVRIDNQNYAGSYATYTIKGATTANLQVKDIYTANTCREAIISSRALEIGINSVLNEFPYKGRSVYIKLPMVTTPGKYQVSPPLPAYAACGDTHITSYYYTQNFGKRFHAVSGELNVTSFNTTTKKLEATFNIQYQDTTSFKETLNISNGKIILNTWDN